MKKLFLTCMMITMACFAVTGCGKKEAAPKAAETTVESSAVQTAKTEAGNAGVSDSAQAESDGQTAPGEVHHVKINIKDYGTITVELDSTYAPITVENFLTLAGDGFYNGLTFHRIMDGFMIQGGDPKGNGMGGSEEMIKGEFSSNGVDNPLSHTRGVISMARSQDKDSASSQFFIVHQDSTFLDGEYAAFGHVTDGMDVVDQICADIKVEDNNGTVKKENQPVIESIEVTD